MTPRQKDCGTFPLLNKVMDESKSVDESELSTNMLENVESGSEEAFNANNDIEEKTASISTKPKRKKTEAEKRRARVRRMAKREARRAEFDIQQLDV